MPLAPPRNVAMNWKPPSLKLVKARDVATDTRKELWRAEGKLQSALSSISEQVTAAERSLAGLLIVSRGRDWNLFRRIRGDGVLGPLYELFSVSDSIFRPAVEAIAGSTLFNVVVSDENVASNLLDVLNREKGGRVTFIPLNRVKIVPGCWWRWFRWWNWWNSGRCWPSSQWLHQAHWQDQFCPGTSSTFESIFGKAVLVPGLDRDPL